jgi:branched-chain amino acid transport system substrate-binding protein
MSGRLERFGSQMTEGAEKAVTEINAHGGLLGRQVKLLVEDDRCDPKHAPAVAEEAADEGSVFVVGHFCSGSSIPASAVYHDRNILMISPSSSNPALTEDATARGWHTVLRVYGRDDRQAEFAGTTIAQRYKGKKVALIGEQSSGFAGTLLAAVKRSMTEAGMPPVLEDHIAPNQADYSDLIREFKSKGIDVVYYAGDAREAAEIVKEARAAGLSIQLLGSDALYQRDFITAAGPAAEGSMFTAEADASHTPGNETHDYAIRTYAAVMLWAAAVEKTGTTDASRLSEVLRSGSWSTVLGPLSFDAEGDPVKPDYSWYVVKDGQISELTN